MTGAGGGSRKSVPIGAADQARIAKALDDWAETGDPIALRTRAFVYLLWDGAIRTKAAVHLNVEEVVEDPASRRIRVVTEVKQRPCEGNAYRGRRFSLSARTRDALSALLRARRDQGGLPNAAGRFEGPLFTSTRGSGRMSQRTAVHSWRDFQQTRLRLSRDYQLDDIVFTGRLSFLRAAGGDTELLSEHASITQQHAASYREHIEPSSSNTTRDVLDRLDRDRMR